MSPLALALALPVGAPLLALWDLLPRRTRQRLEWKLDLHELDGEERQAVLRLLWRLERHP